MKRILANIAYDVAFACIVGAWLLVAVVVASLIVGGIAALTIWGLFQCTMW